MDVLSRITCIEISASISSAHMLEYAAPDILRNLLMDSDVFNVQIRRFLKKVGIQSQREIEHAVLQGIKSGLLDSEDTLHAEVLLRIPAAGIDIRIDGEIALS